MGIPWSHDYASLGAIVLSAFNDPANTRESSISKVKLGSIRLKIVFFRRTSKGSIESLACFNNSAIEMPWHFSVILISTN
jgi:hypothetical protein